MNAYLALGQAIVAQAIGMGPIIAQVAVIHLLSRSTGH